MKGLLKNKTMILFMVMVLGVIYINSAHVHKLESSKVEENLISANIR